MSENGDVLLSFIASKQSEENAFTDDVNDIYGVIFETVDNNGLKELSSKGEPVALTDVNSPIRRMNSLYLDKNEFMVAYTKLDGNTKFDSTQATVDVVHNSEEEKLRISDIDAPYYPLPGNDTIVTVKVANDGLETLEAGKVKLSGVGDGAEMLLDEPLLPGSETMVNVSLSVPEDFCKETALKVSFEGTGEQSEYKTEGEVTLKYDSYFVPKQMPYLNNIPGTNKYISQLTVTNVGNKPGVPQITYTNFINGSESDDDAIVTDYTYDKEINPGGTAVIEHVLENTLADSTSLTKMQVSSGEGYNQKTEGILPTAVVIEGASEDKAPDNSNTDNNGNNDNSNSNNSNNATDSTDNKNYQDSGSISDDNTDGNNDKADNTNNTTNVENKNEKAAKTSDAAKPGLMLALLAGSSVVLMLSVRRKKQAEEE